MLLVFLFHCEYLISGPTNYLEFRETGPWHQDTEAPFEEIL